ncbi:type IVB secretion system protein IcmH/DotU [Falsigemmobacter faecalis]|uniref:Type VI secretion system protein TssL n=1 Tax=Falsigemmobacter faecalis TaxID=2488730 RepID=A0A3P3DH10_9RHOB|nr:type IVB secretion system protein IcmH/DotU [Falsigemmobacter faecalis]RRH73550.1 type VI secretion system protein TssL [Falsigemmobacter faecalis]
MHPSHGALSDAGRALSTGEENGLRWRWLRWAQPDTPACCAAGKESAMSGRDAFTRPDTRSDAGSSDPQSPRPGPLSRRDPQPDDSLTDHNPLLSAASILFSLIGRMRALPRLSDPAALQRAAMAEVRAFEVLALQRGAHPQQVKLARYAVCATLDDVARCRPWAEALGWDRDLMVGRFHRENVGGSRFRDLLASLEENPEQNIDLLEFFHFCLALGFAGELRGTQAGAERLHVIRARLAGLLQDLRRARAGGRAPLGRPVLCRHRERSFLTPLLLAVALVAFLLPAGFLILSLALARQSEAAFAALAAPDRGRSDVLSRRAPAFVPELSQEMEAERSLLETRLAAEIAADQIRLVRDGTTITLSLDSEQLFRRGSDQLRPEAQPLLQRLAAALVTFQGQVLVGGHSDHQPQLSARFPTGLHLTLARAAALRARFADLADPSVQLAKEVRVVRELTARDGRSEGRSQTRRIDISLVMERKE